MIRIRNFGVAALVVTAVAIAVACTPPPELTALTYVSPYTIATGCYGHASGGSDLSYEGPVNAAGNASGYNSTTGRCDAGGTPGTVNIVQAPSLDAARAICEYLGFHWLWENLNARGYPGFPPDAYRCYA